MVKAHRRMVWMDLYSQYVDEPIKEVRVNNSAPLRYFLMVKYGSIIQNSDISMEMLPSAIT